MNELIVINYESDHPTVGESVRPIGQNCLIAFSFSKPVLAHPCEPVRIISINLKRGMQLTAVAKYNKTFNKGWDLTQCQAVGKRLTAFCRARAIEVRSCETNDERFGMVNSYPLTAREAFMETANARIKELEDIIQCGS